MRIVHTDCDPEVLKLFIFSENDCATHHKFCSCKPKKKQLKMDFTNILLKSTFN